MPRREYTIEFLRRSNLFDALRQDTLGAYGHARVKTPNVDRLATQGTRFTDVYAGAPICAPSRCSLHACVALRS